MAETRAKVNILILIVITIVRRKKDNIASKKRLKTIRRSRKITFKNN